MANTNCIAAYTVRIMGPGWPEYLKDAKSNIEANTNFDIANTEALLELTEKSGLSHAEDVINDSLPEGFYCKIENH